jgi:hypothetical protein
MNTSEITVKFHVIMPLGSDDKSDIKVEVINQVAEKYGFIAKFPKYKKGKFDLHHAICDFRQVSFVVADLSFERPSCYYELGIAEAVGVEVYLFAINGTDIHQTSNREYVQFYEDLGHFRLLLDEVFSAIDERKRPTDECKCQEGNSKLTGEVKKSENNLN